jgi:hypothetical protein
MFWNSPKNKSIKDTNYNNWDEKGDELEIKEVDETFNFLYEPYQIDDDEKPNILGSVNAETCDLKM